MANKRGFAKLTPEDEEAERVLRDFEAGKYGSPAKEEPKPTPPPPKSPFPDDELDEMIKKQQKQRGYFKLFQGK